jgi:hypothetical protein
MCWEFPRVAVYSATAGFGLLMTSLSNGEDRDLLSLLGDDHTTDDHTTTDDHSGCGNGTSHSSSGHGAEEPSIFGIGSHLNSSQLFLGFVIVSIILALSGEGLNILEEFTKGTTYHLMLQRIYREIMMMGLLSFGLSLVLLAGVPFPHGLMIAFEFGDLTLFMTSIHFCFQGLWVMFVSIGLGNAWDRASKITTEELLIDVERSNDTSRLWKMLFYPFNVTRNQVEFRIFQSIFSSSYSISTKHTELDFGMFLKMTHENNLLHIIDFDITKWGLILFLVGVGSVKVELYHSTCTNPVCEAEEEIWVFTCCGVVILILSVLLFYWGRRSEMLLIQKSGVESIDDYPVFLMVESQMQIQFEKNVLKTSNVKSAINELMVEAESTKLEAESKKRKVLAGRFKQTARLVATVNTTARPIKDFGVSQTFPPVIQEHSGSSESEVKPFQALSPFGSQKSPHLSPVPSGIPLQVQTFLPSPQTSAREILKTVFSSRGSTLGNEFHDDKHEMAEAAGLTNLQPSFLSLLSPSKIFSGRVSAAVVPVSDLEAPMTAETNSPLHRHQHESSTPPPPCDPPSSAPISSESANQSRKPSQSPWKKAKQLLRQFSSADGENDNEKKEKKKIKTKIKTNFNQQKFPDVFLFHSPETFYLMLHALITCNSLYLALWTTNFAIIANRGHRKGHTAMLIILSILPALFALPFVSQAIKSSSILKAVTKLNLDVVSSVVERTEARIHLLKSFRQNLTKFLIEVHGSEIVHRIAVNQLYEEFNHNCDGLTYEEFLEMLEGCRLYVPKNQTKKIYGEIDINQDGAVTMEVRSLSSLLFSTLIDIDCTHNT